MWLTTPTPESLTRLRIAVALISAVAATSAGYYVYQIHYGAVHHAFVPEPGRLHRRGAIRRPRQSRGNDSSSNSSETPGDENAESQARGVLPTTEGETVGETNADEWWNDPAGYPTSQRAGHNIVNLLFRVSEDNARRNGCVHRGCQCNSCGMVPIRGVRYRCANCADFDLCETCESQGVHIKTHIFYKIRVPAPPFGPRQMQPVWYTGDPDTCRRNLPRGLIARLSRDTGFERPELEAFWEQWTFMANSDWKEDPDELYVAMDRKTFERCLVPTGGSRHASPNLIHDRMFSFYDSNDDDLIGFAEFLRGLSYRKRKDKLKKVFDGYDIDGDGYVNRRDFLRMFRAYYVLYKQMHKDILDGLEDQLLASTEAQQLAASRQPLSSLFGREGRVPSADGNLSFEGKSYQPDGQVDVAQGYEHAVATDRQDTAEREDIMTSLFAYETDQRGHDSDRNWRTVRRLSAHDPDRTYWVTLLDPPTTLEELPGALMGNPIEADETEDEEEEGGEEGEGEGEVEDAEGDGDHDAPSTSGPASNLDQFAADRIPSESEVRASYINQMRQQAPLSEKRRRDMARRQLHERWKRRQFYLDEEEGGHPPEDWNQKEDILANGKSAGESTKEGDQQTSPISSRSSSRVRFAEETEDVETRSNASSSPRSLPERWGGMEIPSAEKDAGREILYQVTQQAFNELLDTIFKPSEDLATEAAETRARRERHKAAIDAIELAGEDSLIFPPPATTVSSSADKPIAEKTLSELLADTGFGVIDNQHSRNATEIEAMSQLQVEEFNETLDSDLLEEEYKDPTLPQFRPNSQVQGSNFPSPEGRQSPFSQEDADDGDNTSVTTSPSEPPDEETLQRWKQLTLAEEVAAKRGGWGRLSFVEFEEIYKSQEHQGNRLDYLGSWIDFCIP